MQSKPIIGLAGGIGSGKTTVADLLGELGAAVISSDALNREQLADAGVQETLRQWWGDTIVRPDGELDRVRIAGIIFEDQRQRHRLEAYLHPRIARARDRLIEAYGVDAAVRAIVLDSPLLVESHLDVMCDAVVFIDADDDVRRKRVTERRGWTEAEWRRREKSQNALDKKRERADYVLVNNSSDLASLRHRVEELLQEIIRSPRRNGVSEPAAPKWALRTEDNRSATCGLTSFGSIHV